MESGGGFSAPRFGFVFFGRQGLAGRLRHGGLRGRFRLFRGLRRRFFERRFLRFGLGAAQAFADARPLLKGLGHQPYLGDKDLAHVEHFGDVLHDLPVKVFGIEILAGKGKPAVVVLQDIHFDSPLDETGSRRVNGHERRFGQGPPPVRVDGGTREAGATQTAQ